MKGVPKSDKKFWTMVEEATKNAKARRGKPAARKEWAREYSASLKVETTPIPTSDRVIGSCSTKSIHDSRWKNPYRNMPEMEEREAKAQQEVDRKAKMVAPIYSKGPTQYITPGADLTTLGRKI